MCTDVIDKDIITNNYQVILPCFNIYKSGGIKAVNDYLRSVPSNIREQQIFITNTDTTKEQKIVITDNQEQTTNTDSNNIGLNKNLNTIFIAFV